MPKPVPMHYEMAVGRTMLAMSIARKKSKDGVFGCGEEDTQRQEKRIRLTKIIFVTDVQFSKIFKT